MSLEDEGRVIAARAQELYERHNLEVSKRADRIFGGLMILQWMAAIVLSVVVAPKTWTSPVSEVYYHVYLALGLGALVTIPPLLMVWAFPGYYWNRFGVSAAQMAMGSLLIHLSGGRIETHFHIFGSLACLVFYRDWRVYLPATLVAGLDHIMRGLFFPESIFGSNIVSSSRIVEHIFWVLFEDGFLMYFTYQIQSEMLVMARQRARETYLAQVRSALGEQAQEVETLQTLLQQLEVLGVQVTGATTSLAATAREQEASISQQASAATQIKATSREISATTQELVFTMEEVATGAEETAGFAKAGRGLLGTMQTSMDQTVSAAGQIAHRLSVLNEKADKISGVVITISKVADQTNLLSLNAAIEAEKAGEFGRGFGVVAREIRRLADQTAVATLDIEQTIREVQSAVSAGVMGMEKFSEELRLSAEAAHSVVDGLGQIIARVQVMTERFEQVNYGMRSQAQAAGQIAENIGQLSDATQHTAASIRDFNSVIETLRDATHGMAMTVSRYRISSSASNVL